MHVFPLLQLLDPDLAPERCKVHLAVFNGTDDPLDVYAASGFEEWQSWQSQLNFSRDFVISLIRLSEPDRWLFAGAFDAFGATRVTASGSRWVEDGSQLYRYQLDRRSGPDELDGRLIVDFKRPGRQPYLLGENYADVMYMAGIREGRYCH